jgi:hypothetical protein
MCYNKIIGITETANNCFNSSESLSGFYLDDMDEGYIPVIQGFYNNKEIIDSSLLKLIENATKEVIRESHMFFDKYLVKKYMQQVTSIGNINNYTNVTDAKNVRFLWINPKIQNGGFIVVNKIQIKLQNGNYLGNVKIINEQLNLVDDLNINEIVNYKLPLNKTYYFVYESLIPPLNFNHLACCGQVNKWDKYFGVGSGSFDNDYQNLTPIKNDLCQGIYIDCTLDCDPFLSLCNVDFKNTNFGISFSHAVKQTARKNFAYWLLTNDKVSPYTMINRDELVGVIDYLKKDIEENLKYLPTVYNITDCYLCKENFYKSEIII